MKFIIGLFGVIALANGASIAYYTVPTVRSYPIVYSAQSSSLFTPTQQQYHHQDDLGQYAYGYSEPLSTKEEVRSLDGITRGFYSYRDAAGKLQMVDYTADADGFHVAATNLPQNVRPAMANTNGETVEVAAARKAHFAAHEDARIRLAKANAAANVENEANMANMGNVESIVNAANANVRSLEAPQPVADTVEVAAAKQAHLERHEHEKLRNEMLAARDSIGFVRSTLPVAYRPAALPTFYSYSYPFNSRFYYY